MIRRSSQKAVFAATLLTACGVANAIPTLQLGILGGVYDPSAGVETAIAQADSFKLYAFLTPGPKDDLSALLADTYYVSAALMPKTAPPGGSVGSFTFNGTTVNVTGDMTYGTPPLEGTLATTDPGDLAEHGIFATYFSEFSFKFAAGDQYDPLDVGSVAAGDLAGLTAGTGMYFKVFDINVAFLTAGSAIHFDLYNSKIVECAKSASCVPGDIDINDFAPYSHDAQSGDDDDSGQDDDVPEPGTLGLMGIALLGLGLARRRRGLH